MYLISSSHSILTSAYDRGCGGNSSGGGAPGPRGRFWSLSATSEAIPNQSVNQCLSSTIVSRAMVSWQTGYGMKMRFGHACQGWWHTSCHIVTISDSMALSIAATCFPRSHLRDRMALSKRHIVANDDWCNEQRFRNHTRNITAIRQGLPDRPNTCVEAEVDPIGRF